MGIANNWSENRLYAMGYNKAIEDAARWIETATVILQRRKEDDRICEWPRDYQARFANITAYALRQMKMEDGNE